MENHDSTEKNSPDRRVTLSCRLLPEQKFLIIEKARKMNLTLSQYAEAKILREDNFVIEEKINQQQMEIRRLKSQLESFSANQKQVENLTLKINGLLKEREQLLDAAEENDSLLEENNQLRQSIDSLQNQEAPQQEVKSELNFPWKWIGGGMAAILLIIGGYLLFRKKEDPTPLIETVPPPPQNNNPQGNNWNPHNGIPPFQ